MTGTNTAPGPDGATNNDDGLVLTNGTARAIFSSAGARLCSLRFDDNELLRTTDERRDVWFGGFVMAPWSGILPGSVIEFEGTSAPVPNNWGDFSLHGLTRLIPWRQVDGALVAELPPSWPFGGSIRLKPTLTANSLQIQYTISAGRTRMPAAIGFHPWFLTELANGRPLTFVLPSDSQQRDSGQPNGPDEGWSVPKPGPWDDCFRTAGPFTLTWPGAGTLKISSTGNYFGVFNQEESGIAVEPMTSPPGVMVDVLQPWESLALRVTLEWECS